MPKNKGKGGKNRRRGKNENENEKRELVFKEDGQEYAQVSGQGRRRSYVVDAQKVFVGLGQCQFSQCAYSLFSIAQSGIVSVAQYLSM